MSSIRRTISNRFNSIKGSLTRSLHGKNSIQDLEHNYWFLLKKYQGYIERKSRSIRDDPERDQQIAILESDLNSIINKISSIENNNPNKQASDKYYDSIDNQRGGKRRKTRKQKKSKKKTRRYKRKTNRK